MILEKNTFERYGYYAKDLTRHSSKKIIAKCDDCGKIRDVQKSAYRAFCLGCARKLKNRPNSISTKITILCDICGKSLKRYPSQIKNKKRNYCSRECMGIGVSNYQIAENSVNWKGGEVPRNCLICGKRFTCKPSGIKKGGGKYCSPHCMGIARSRIYVGANAPGWKGGEIPQICLICGNFLWSINRELKREGENIALFLVPYQHNGIMHLRKKRNPK